MRCVRSSMSNWFSHLKRGIKVKRFFLLMACAVVVGCGGMGSSGAVYPAGYRTLTQEVAALVETHRTNAAVASTVDACLTERARYDVEVRPKLEMMQSQSRGMDNCMMQMGRAGDADLATTCGSMMSELNGHKTTACASADATVNKAEAVRHCDAMKTWLDAAQNRASSLGSRCR